jgi:hypothetical protein
VRFVRHLAAALLAAAVIVALGVAWAHSPAASWIGAGNSRPGRHVAPVGLRTLPHGLLKAGADRIVAGPVHIRAGVVLNLPSILDLVRTVVIEAVFIAVVVLIDVARRRRRRARRTASRPLSP